MKTKTVITFYGYKQRVAHMDPAAAVQNTMLDVKSVSKIEADLGKMVRITQRDGTMFTADGPVYIVEIEDNSKSEFKSSTEGYQP